MFRIILSSNLFLKLLTHILSDHKILKKLPTFFELTKQRQRKLRDIFYKGTPFEFWVHYKIKNIKLGSLTQKAKKDATMCFTEGLEDTPFHN